MSGPPAVAWNAALSFVEIRSNPNQLIVLCGLYPYRRELRAAILNAKVDGSHLALSTLREMWVQHALPGVMARQSSGIAAATPSAWSRIRGKTDLAGVFAFDLQRASGRPAVATPWSAAWRFRKRSFGGSRQRRGPGRESQPSENITKKERVIVVVDDVLTTGFTMESLAKKIDATEVWCIALAATPR